MTLSLLKKCFTLNFNRSSLRPAHQIKQVQFKRSTVEKCFSREHQFKVKILTFLLNYKARHSFCYDRTGVKKIIVFLPQEKSF